VKRHLDRDPLPIRCYLPPRRRHLRLHSFLRRRHQLHRLPRHRNVHVRYGSGARPFVRVQLRQRRRLLQRVRRLRLQPRAPVPGVAAPDLLVLLLLWESDSDGSSWFGFGFDSATQTKNSRSTPLIPSVVTPYSDLYIVNLTTIKVNANGEDLDGIPAGTFDLRPDGSAGGVFLSTTTPVTFLEEAAYDVVKKALAAPSIKVQPVNNGSELGLDLCYTTQSLDNTKPFPTLALVFDGVDAVMKLQRDNYFFSDNESGLDCLTILPFHGRSILGSLLQTGRNMTYDIAGAKHIFDVEAHTAAASSPHSLVSHTTKILFLLAAWLLLF
jgi:hypothetical protein